MLSADFFVISGWWATLFICGLAFLPLTFLLFENFFDKGYIFSKLIGLALTSYVIFLVGVLHIATFSQIEVLILFLILSFTLFLIIPNKWRFVYLLRKGIWIFIFEEALFALALFTWAYIHSFNPEIRGLEKYMDFGFINSILRADYFPPKDMWFTPLYINYYYFGHFMTAMLTKASGIQSALTFDLMLSTIFAFCVTESFSIGANLYSLLQINQQISHSKKLVNGIVTALLVALSGNLHIIYAFFKPYANDKPQPVWDLLFTPFTFPNSYWYPNATRFIYNTIHEFPIYSWVVADLHGHVLDIPFVLLTISLLLNMFISYANVTTEKRDVWIHALFRGRSLSIFPSMRIHPFYLAVTGFFLAIMYMTNAWDGAIYLLLASFVIFYLFSQEIGSYKKMTEKEDPLVIIPKMSAVRLPALLAIKPWFALWGRDILFSILIIFFSFSLIAFPYNFFFKPFVSGIGVLCAPHFLTQIGKIGPFLFEANHCQHSLWWEMLMLYGFFYFFVLSFLIFVAKSKKIAQSDIFVLLLITLSTLLIILPEFIYVKDIYPAHYRANTMFKLVFQAFMMLSISSSYIIFRLIWHSETKNIYYRFIFPIFTLVLFGLVMTYPRLAINSYYGDLKNYQGLDGMKYLSSLYPTDYPAIQWLNKNIKGQPIILEAQSDSYTDYARISANTGLPTVLGWTVHEWLWRGSYDIPAPRITDVKTLYETQDKTTAKNLLEKYNVSYVFIGTLEFQKYPQLSEAKFGELGKIVYQNGTTKIYKVKK